MSHDFPVEAGHVMQFKRALGDYDAAYEEDTLAPPTFVAAAAHHQPDYPLRPHAGQPWMGSAKEPSGLTGPLPASGARHGEQHYVYHRPLRAGDVLTATTRPGERWEKTSRSGKTLYFHDLVSEYRDAAGELVVTARAVVVDTDPPKEEA